MPSANQRNSKLSAPSREDHGWVASARGRGGAPVCAPVHHRCNLDHTQQLITAAVHFHLPVRILAVKVCQFSFDAIVVVHKLAVCQYRIFRAGAGFTSFTRLRQVVAVKKKTPEYELNV